MGLFSRKPKRPTTIPEPYLRGLRDWGEHLAGRRAASDAGLMADIEMMDFAQDDPDAYLESLVVGIFHGPAHISGYAGSCCLGATETAVHMYELDVSSPAWDRIVDPAIDYLRSNRIPYGQLKPYAKQRWEQKHSSSDW